MATNTNTELIIADARAELAKKHRCAPELLEYIGTSDCNFLGKGKELMYFNILDDSHVAFKSTVTIKNWSEEVL